MAIDNLTRRTTFEFTTVHDENAWNKAFGVRTVGAELYLFVTNRINELTHGGVSVVQSGFLERGDGRTEFIFAVDTDEKQWIEAFSENSVKDEIENFISGKINSLKDGGVTIESIDFSEPIFR